MPVSHRALATVPAILAATVALTTPAHAATLQVPPCVVDYGVSDVLNLAIAGFGFTPGAVVGIESTTAGNPEPRTVTGTNADAGGNFTLKQGPLSFNSYNTTEQSYDLVATDRANPANTATATLRQVRFGFDAKPDTGKPDRKVIYTARGFAPGQPVYAHFRFGGKTRRNVKIGTAVAPCGSASKRMRLLPTTSRFGTWTIYVDQVKVFSPKTARTGLSAKGSLVIRRVFR